MFRKNHKPAPRITMTRHGIGGRLEALTFDDGVLIERNPITGAIDAHPWMTPATPAHWTIVWREFA